MKTYLILALLLIGASAMAQTNPTTVAIHTKTWHYDFSSYVVDVTFHSDTSLTWRDIKRTETDKAKTWYINEHTTLVGWREDSNTDVSLYSDFATGQTYCHVFQANGVVRPLQGRFVLKNE